jgi:hypothetical protein
MHAVSSYIPFVILLGLKPLVLQGFLTSHSLRRVYSKAPLDKIKHLFLILGDSQARIYLLREQNGVKAEQIMLLNL